MQDMGKRRRRRSLILLQRDAGGGGPPLHSGPVVGMHAINSRPLPFLLSQNYKILSKKEDRQYLFSFGKANKTLVFPRGQGANFRCIFLWPRRRTPCLTASPPFPIVLRAFQKKRGGDLLLLVLLQRRPFSLFLEQAGGREAHQLFSVSSPPPPLFKRRRAREEAPLLAVGAIGHQPSPSLHGPTNLQSGRAAAAAAAAAERGEERLSGSSPPSSVPTPFREIGCGGEGFDDFAKVLSHKLSYGHLFLSHWRHFRRNSVQGQAVNATSLPLPASQKRGTGGG